MRFRASDFGTLVRPKTISHLYLWTKEKSVDEWWKGAISRYRWCPFEKKQQLTLFYKKKLPVLFQELKLGNAFLSPETSYVAKISSFIIMHKGFFHFVDSKEKALNFEKEIKKRFGTNAYLSVVAVGLKFHTGFSLSKTNGGVAKFTEGKAWEHTDREDNVWFYQPKEIIPLENVILFEQVVLGDLVILKRIFGVVIKISNHSKPQFYLANSSVSKNITIFTATCTQSRLTPDKRFKVLKQTPK